MVIRVVVVAFLKIKYKMNGLLNKHIYQEVHVVCGFIQCVFSTK